MEPGDAYRHALDQVLGKISIYDGEETFSEQFLKANLKHRHLFASHWCQSEVRNGGFLQFFWNSTGILAPEAVIAFKAIKMPNAATLIEGAMKFFGLIYPRDRSKRVEMLDAYRTQNPSNHSPFDAIDSEFLKLLDEESGGFEIVADKYALFEE
jgi:Domain of unknown function (DUF4375)